MKEAFLGFMGFTSGFAVAAGTFAFLIVIGVVPRMIGKSNTAAQILKYEDMIIAGGILGNLSSVYTDFSFRIPFGKIWLFLFGICSGIHVGCISVALAEILNTFPIMFRRMRLKQGLEWVIVFMALGKSAGAFYYFFIGNFS